MKSKKVLVTLKYFKGELNPFDASALECALCMSDVEVIALSMAPLSSIDHLKSVSRLGVKCVLVSDLLYAGSDTQATSYILAEAIKLIEPDYVFCGRQSVDGDTAQVPPMLAQRLGLDFVNKVINFDGQNLVLRDGRKETIKENTVYTFEKFKTLRFPSIFSKAQEILVWDNQKLNLPTNLCGIKGSPTRVVKSYESAVGRRFCKFIEEKDLDAIIKNALIKNEIEQAISIGEKLPVVHYVGKVQHIADRIGEQTVCVNFENKTINQIASELLRDNAKVVIWEDTDALKILAAKLAVVLNAGLCADCIDFKVENGRLIMTRPAQGGTVTADIVCESSITFATARTVKKSDKDIIFTVGYGAISKIEEITNLAKKYNAEVCATRKVVDSGKMPYTSQVGLTGKTVSPKVYVAFGVSGAVQHTCAISGAGTIIAINKYKNERIFDYADYGIIKEI